LDDHFELSALSGIPRIGNGDGEAIVNGVGGNLLPGHRYRCVVMRRSLGGEETRKKKEGV